MIAIQKHRISNVISDLAAYLLSHKASMSHSLKENFFSDNGEVIGDSLLRVQMASYVGQLFNLQPQVAEELSTKKSLDCWSSIVLENLNDRQSNNSKTNLTFMTSGTTGVPKRISHCLQDLELEAAHWANIFNAEKIYSFVPAHHIYGFIWTVILPSIKNVPVINGRGRIPAGLVDSNQVGLIVAVPDQCPMLMTLSDEQQRMCDLVLSTAPCSDDLLLQLNSQSWRSVSVIYGSTETGAIGVKRHANEPFNLLPYLVKKDSPQAILKNETELDLQDILTWSDNSHFFITGRKDGVVQHRGYNLKINEIERQLKQCELVEDAKVEVDMKIPTSLIFNLSIRSADDRNMIVDWIKQNFAEFLQPNVINWSHS